MLITHTHTLAVRVSHLFTVCLLRTNSVSSLMLRAGIYAPMGGTNLADGTSQGRARKHAAGVPERAGDGAQPAEEVQHSREICGSRGTQKGEGSRFVMTGVCVPAEDSLPLWREAAGGRAARGLRVWQGSWGAPTQGCSGRRAAPPSVRKLNRWRPLAFQSL